MSSLWPSALKSFDDSLALLCENLEKLKAAKSVDIAEVIEQVKTAGQSAQIVREFLSSELPEALWQNREELDALIEEIRQRIEARNVEQLRSRLLALATELERGSIAHRRALRLNELNQLRDQAINELRSQAALEGTPQNLPGPPPDRWIEWACSLEEPQDAESLECLRNGFACLDDFVANLEPNMWMAAGLPTFQTQPETERSAENTQEEQSQLETTGFEEKLRLPDGLDELSLPALESNTSAPNDLTSPQTEEEIQRTLAQERAQLASMMGLDSSPVPNSEHPSIAEALCETGAAPAFTSDTGVGVGEPRNGKWWLLATAAVLAFAALGAIQWRSHRNGTSNRSVEASEIKVPEPTRSNLQDKLSSQARVSAVSETHTSSPLVQAQEQPKSQGQSVAPRPLSKAAPAKQPEELHNVVLQPAAATPRNIAMVKKEELPPNDTAEMPVSIPGGVPKGVPSSLSNMVKDIPVAVPKIADKVRVSSGVAQGLLVHQVMPQYPPLARQARIQGTVVFQAVIGKDGTVQNLHVLSGHAILIQAARDAVSQWRYKPYYLNGEPVAADTQINVNFTLPGG